MNQPAYVIGIGASGVEGLANIGELLENWPSTLNASVFVVLHRPSEKISFLADVLGRKSRLPVVTAVNEMVTSAGVCYVSEADQALAIGAGEVIACLPAGGNRYRNHTVDVLFESIANIARTRALGIILSGSLADGSVGLAAIHEAGGLTMVLDPGKKPRGMQQNAIDYDGPITYIADMQGLLLALGGELSYRVVRRRVSDQ